MGSLYICTSEPSRQSHERYSGVTPRRLNWTNVAKRNAGGGKALMRHARDGDHLRVRLRNSPVGLQRRLAGFIHKLSLRFVPSQTRFRSA